MPKVLAHNVNRAVCPAGQTVFDDAFHTLWTHTTHHYFPTNLLTNTKSLFQGVAVGFVHFKGEVSLFNPLPLLVNTQDCVLIRNLRINKEGKWIEEADLS